MKKSVWVPGSELPCFPKLCGDIKTDVLIIGGGICGVLCAYMLKCANVDYVLAEGSTVCSDITRNTTAKITSQHGLIYNKLIKSIGRENAALYLKINEDAIQKYAEISKNIDCDFEKTPSAVYSLSDRQKIEDEVSAVNSLGFKAEFCEKTSLPFDVAGAVKFFGQAQFNPLKFVSGIVGDLNIYEHTFIKGISQHKAYFDGGSVKAKKIIVATHFPFINKHGSYFLKLYQHRSYVIALENAKSMDAMYVDEEQNGMSFRNYGNFLLIGGGDHRTGKSGGCWDELRRFAKKYYPGAKERYYWATQDCMSLDGIAYIGNYSKSTPDLYTATGFNKWGITTSMAAAMILTDMVSERKSEYTDLFSPHRSMIKKQLFINGFESVSNLLTPSLKRCPHMGCALKWNKYEHTWDCPCHGSRFEEDGTLINNPAVNNCKTV